MTSGKSNLVDIKYDEWVCETANAILVTINEENIWFPKSIIEIDKEKMELTMPRGFAIEKGVL